MIKLLYNRHGVFGFCTSLKMSVSTIVCSLVVYNFVYIVVDAIIPSREAYTTEVSQTKTKLLQTMGKVVEIYDQEQLAELIRYQPCLCILLYSTTQPVTEQRRRLMRYNESLAKEYTNKAVIAQVDVSLVDGLIESVTEQDIAVWLPLHKGKPLPATRELHEVKSTLNRIVKLSTSD